MAKLPSGTRKRKDGTLEKRFTVNGKRFSVYGVNTKEITEKENLLRNQIRQGTYIKNKEITLNQYFKEWIKRKETHVSGNTIHTYTIIYNKHISDKLGKEKIKDLERRQIIDFQSAILSDGLNPTSANYTMTVLKAILNDSVKDEILVKNPSSNIKSIKTESKATETYHRALTIQEQKVFMDALKGEYYYNFIAFMLLTGLRFGEVSALTWNDIDYNKNVIHINKTITKDKNGIVVIGDTTKTESGKRDIPINNTIKALLKDIRNTYNYLPFNTKTVFCSTSGDIVRVQRINNVIIKTLKKLEKSGIYIKPFTSHAFRDTFATRFIEQGGNMKTLQKILGHSSITMTMDLYAHVLPDTMQEEMNNIQIVI